MVITEHLEHDEHGVPGMGEHGVPGARDPEYLGWYLWIGMYAVPRMGEHGVPGIG